MDYKILIGTLLILYGLAKVTFSILELRPNHVDDDTFAGKFLIFILLAFGLYSFIHGIGMVLHETKFGKFVHNTSVISVVYIIFGVTLIELYSIIAYTDLPISKDQTQLDKYKLLGVGGGVLFIMFVVMKLLWDRFRGRDLPESLNFDNYVLCFWFVILFAILLAVLVDSRSIFKGNGIKGEVTSLGALFLNVDVV